MQYRFLGKDRLKVSAIGYGCPPFQGKLSDADENQAIAVLHRAIEIGMNFIDTADHNNGNNEEILAKALKGRRADVVLTTKFGNLRGQPWAEGPRGGRQAGVCRMGLRQFAPAAANRLHRSLLFASGRSQSTHRGHRRRDGAAGGAGKSPSHRLERSGAAKRCAAPTRFTRSPPCRANIRSGRGTTKPIRFPSRASSVSATSPTMRSDAAFSAACSRLFGPRRKGSEAARAAFPRREFSTQREFAQTASRRSPKPKKCTVAQLALAWILHQGDFFVPIPGTYKIAHLEANAAAADIHLTLNELAAIDRIFPRRRGRRAEA